jgi:pimeloyl-ACP methyl ester carboxylesterase
VSREARSRRRLFAVDLLGFGRSPKPADSLYTLREHVEMIERSVIRRHGVGSFHIVAHSLGCILALALAVKYPAAVKSITLVAPVMKFFNCCQISIYLYPPVTMKME